MKQKPKDQKPVNQKPTNQRQVTIWAVAIVVVAALAYLVTRPAGPVMKDIGNAEAQRLIASGARLVDVRTVQEFEAGHIPGSENVPVDQVQQSAQGWDRDRPILLYCATGSRSLNASRWLASNGFRKVYNLKQGVVAWDQPLSTEPSSGGAQTVQTNGKPVLLEFSSNS